MHVNYEQGPPTARPYHRFMHRIVRYVLALSAALCGVSSAGESAVRSPAYDADRGHTLYIASCSSCHGADGAGHPGTFPPIKGSRMVTKADATSQIRTVLDGLRGAKAGGVLYAAQMPPFRNSLNDIDIADIIDFERSSWGNHGKPVTAAEVAAQRGHSKD
jgi:cytochrome c oxidase cbb3-type subunit 2